MSPVVPGVPHTPSPTNAVDLASFRKDLSNSFRAAIAMRHFSPFVLFLFACDSFAKNVDERVCVILSGAPGALLRILGLLLCHSSGTLWRGGIL
jgi:hypothetical protein